MLKVSSPARWVAALALTLSGFALPMLAAPDPTTHTAVFLGGYLTPGMPVGTVDDTTEWYDNATDTWKPAFLVGSHPWGFAPDTNTWINCGPSTNTCLNTTVLYRVRFALPAEFTDAEMSLYINADNAGTFFLNGVQVGNRHVGNTNQFLTIHADADLLVPGINELLISVEDWGGLAGFNYRADFSITSESPITPVPPGDQPDADGDVIPDDTDAFPNDPTEWADADGDGVGDNSDLAPNDPTIGNEPPDADADGVPDSEDAFPDDPNESVDSDGDGVGNNGDAFPDNPNESADSDGDGVGDNGDAFPNNPNESVDSDGDGVGDNGDAFPNSNLGAQVMVGGCATGVANGRFSNGATMNDLLGAAAAGAANHGAYVSAVSQLSDSWKKAGLITGKDHGKITSCAARSK